MLYVCMYVDAKVRPLSVCYLRAELVVRHFDEEVLQVLHFHTTVFERDVHCRSCTPERDC